MVAFVLGARFHACDIAAAAGLRHRDGEDVFAADAPGQPAGFLLLGTELAEIGADQPVVQGHEEARIAIAGIFLDQDLLEAKIRLARAAVFLVGPHQQQALPAGLQESLAIDNTLFVPLFRVRLNLVLQKAAHRIAEHVVFVIE